MRDRTSWTRVGAIARHDLRILRSDPAFLVIFSVVPLWFMAISERSIELTLRAELGDTGLSGASFAVPGATVLFSGFMASNVAFGIFREHGWRTWERLRSSPLTPTELMLGKSVVPALTLAINLTVLLGGGALLFDLELRGSLPGFLLVAVGLGLMELALGFMLLALCRSAVQLNAVSNAGTMLLGGLGGAVEPVEVLPGWAQALSPATPAYWAVEGFRAVTLEPGGFGDVLGPFAVLLGFAALFALVARARFEVESTKIAWA